MIKIKEIEINIKWWQIALILVVVIIGFKIDPNEALEILKQAAQKWLSG